MKKIIEKIKQDGVIEPIATILFTVLFLTFVIYPFLTEANTLHNLIGLIFAIGILIFDYYYFSVYFHKGEDELLNPGETELDYIPEEDLKPKKKSNPKQFDGVESDKPFVKTRKKRK